jgi:putative protein-disulfide isomerase
MVTGDRVGPIGEVAAYISSAYKRVEETTGVKFGQNFLRDVLEEGSLVFDSFPPSRALTAFRHFEPDKSVLFAADIQDAIYHLGMNPNEVEIYQELASKYDIDKKSYRERYELPATEVETREDFVFAGKLGVTGYPTVFFQYQQEYFLIARGYTGLEVVQNRLDHIVARVKNENKSIQ